MNPDTARDLFRLVHHAMGNRACPPVGGDNIKRGAGQRGKRIEAEVAPKLEPDIISYFRVDFSLQPACFHGIRKLCNALRDGARRFSKSETIAINMLHHARRDNFSRRIYCAPYCAMRPDGLPLPALGVDGFELEICILALNAMEIPPGNSVLRRYDRSVGAKKRGHLFCRFPRLMRFECDDHIILRPKVFRVGGCGHPCNALLPVDQELEALRSNSLQMRTPRYERDVRAALLQAHGHVAAYRARAVD